MLKFSFVLLFLTTVTFGCENCTEKWRELSAKQARLIDGLLFKKLALEKQVGELEKSGTSATLKQISVTLGEINFALMNRNALEVAPLQAKMDCVEALIQAFASDMQHLKSDVVCLKSKVENLEMRQAATESKVAEHGKRLDCHDILFEKISCNMDKISDKLISSEPARRLTRQPEVLVDQARSFTVNVVNTNNNSNVNTSSSVSAPSTGYSNIQWSAPMPSNIGFYPAPAPAPVVVREVVVQRQYCPPPCPPVYHPNGWTNAPVCPPPPCNTRSRSGGFSISGGVRIGGGYRN